MQIQKKLTLQFIIIVAGIMLFAMSFVYLQFQNILIDDFYNNLKSKAVMTAEMTVGYNNSKSNFPEENKEADDEINIYTENVSIYDMDFNKLYSYNHSSEEYDLSILQNIVEQKEYRFKSGKFRVLGSVYKNKNGIPYILISEAIFNQDYLNILANILIWISVILVIMVAFSGWVFAGQALSPIRKIMNEVDSIQTSDLNFRLSTTQKNDEISRLVVTFNSLLNRIQNVFDTQKQFLSNISHELKNPLSIIISQLEVILVKRRNEVEYVETLNSVLEDVKSLNEASEKLMQLARISSESALINQTAIRVDELLWSAKTMLNKSRPDYHIRIEIENLPEEESQMYTVGSEQLLKTALVNILENSCKYSNSQEVVISLSINESKKIVIEIRDQGIGIPDEELELVYEPFYRSTISNNFKGSGIGLSLVSSILNLHNIEYKLRNNSDGGTTTTLYFASGKSFIPEKESI